MAETVFQMLVAGYPLRYAFLYPRTRMKLRPLPLPVEGEEADVRVPPEKIELGRNFLTADSSDDYVEYRCLIELTARALLRYGCSIFHAVSFVWRDRAWLLTGPSGVGKTTQYFNWQRLFPGEITMISGDMPVLEAQDDGSVRIHPSSWNGKEDLHSALSAPLGGLILLEQGRENRIAPLPPRDAVGPVYKQFMALPETEEEILQLTRLEDRLLRAAPVWKLVNLGDEASTLLLRRTLEQS